MSAGDHWFAGQDPQSGQWSPCLHVAENAWTYSLSTWFPARELCEQFIQDHIIGTAMYPPAPAYEVVRRDLLGGAVVIRWLNKEWTVPGALPDDPRALAAYLDQRKREHDAYIESGRPPRETK